MQGFAAEAAGYAAAVVTNVSVYPQAYEVYVIVKTGEHEKLLGISLCMYVLQASGCVLWLIYACAMGLYPIIFGSVLCLVPSTYIAYCVAVHRPTGVVPDDAHGCPSEIIIATGSSYAVESPAPPDHTFYAVSDAG